MCKSIHYLNKNTAVLHRPRRCTDSLLQYRLDLKLRLIKCPNSLNTAEKPGNTTVVSDHAYTAGARNCDWNVVVSITAMGVASVNQSIGG